MLVQFESSETAEVLMFAETARLLLEILGKECSARGVFTQPEMQPAAEALRRAIAAAPEPEPDEEEEAEIRARRKELPVGLRQRAWPLLDMLERTSRAGVDARIVWEAPSDF